MLFVLNILLYIHKVKQRSTWELTVITFIC